MNIRIVSLLIIFGCTAIAQKPEAIQVHLEQVKKEESPKITIGKYINRIAIETAPIWVPIAVSFILDSLRGKLCDKICEKIDPQTTFDLGIAQVPTKDAVRICLEGGSRFALYSLLYGSFENGSFKPNLSNENIKSVCSDTINFTMTGYIIPGTIKHMNTKLNPVATSIANFAPYAALHRKNVSSEFCLRSFGHAQRVQEYVFFEHTGVGNILKKVIKSSWYLYMYHPRINAVLNKVKQPQNSNQ